MEDGKTEIRFLKILFLVLYLGIVSYAGSENFCPAGCLCHLTRQPRTVTCSNLRLETFPENISDVVEHLDLSNNMLIEITDDIGRLVELQYLNLARNQLSYLPESIGNLKNLRRLDLSRNEISDSINLALINKLPSIAVVYLARNPLTNLYGLKSSVLQALDASHCDIKELERASLEGLPALVTLSLAGNPLKVIRSPSSEKLRWLDMSDCLLNYLNPDTFSGFPELEELHLANNPMLVYSTRHSTLQHLNLKRLDVSRCNLDRPGLHGLPLLTHAKLSHNTIRLLPDRIFAKNRHLTHLLLNANGLESLNASTFEGLVKLQLLDLSANSLETVHSSTFLDNIDLRILNLSYNTLNQFPNFTSSLTTLDLSYNFIDKFDKYSLTNMPRIKNLNLSDNRLQWLPDRLRSSSLITLTVRNNRLVGLSNNSFVETPNLYKIDISGNRLTEAIAPEVFRNNFNLMVLRLDDNPWRCDCGELYPTYEYLTQPVTKTQTSSLICQSPANVSGYTWETACYDVWNEQIFNNDNRTWGLVLVCLFTLIVLIGSAVSIRHTMKAKRRAAQERQRLETIEANREALRRLQRRNQRLEEELLERPTEPRIHPLALLGPPSYEEAVQMPRLAHSLDELNDMSAENVNMTALGSVDNLRNKKRRSRRPRKRVQSEDNLLRMEERREERLRRERNDSVTTNVGENSQTSTRNPPNSRASSTRRVRRNSVAVTEDLTESGSSRGRPRPQTPSAKKKKRRTAIRDGHSTDDEDSDMQIITNDRTIVIRELRREPRSGYREVPTE